METILISANAISVIYLIVGVLSILQRKNLQKSASKLVWVGILCMINCGLDAACYWMNGQNESDGLLLVICFGSYCLRSVTLLFFSEYVYTYITEITACPVWYRWLPDCALLFSFIYSVVAFFMGKIVTVDQGLISETGGLPGIVVGIQIGCLIYFPLLAFAMKKQIGVRSFFFLGLFGIFPIIASLMMLMGGMDFFNAAEALAYSIICLLLQTRYSYEKEQDQKQYLTKRNDELIHANEENEAQLEEIRALNYTLEEKQAKLEEYACEQESQIEEITALNMQLQEKQEHLKTRFDIIQSMSSVYFVSYYIDLRDDTYLELSATDTIRSVIHPQGRAQESLYIACEKLIVPEYREIMHSFWDLSTIDERLHQKRAVTCEYIGVTTGWSRAYLIAGDRDEDGNLNHIFYAATIIHDEKEKMDEQIKKLEDYNSIIANAGLGIWHIILKDEVPARMQINEKMGELLGLQDMKLSEEDTYSFWHDRITPEAIDSVQKSVMEMIQGDFSENTYLWNHPIYGDRYVRCGGTAKHLEDGSCVLSGYHYDVTSIVISEERQKKELAYARQQAEKASKAKTAFLFSMSHDIRTPMNAIVGYTNALEKHVDDRDKVLDYVHKIQNSNDFLLSLVNNVLEMARIESGKVDIDEVPISIAKLSQEICSVYSELMKSKQIDFVQHYQIKTEYAYSDVTKVKEIYLNIISNAYKYTPPGGRITWEYRELPIDRKGYIILQSVITDTGIGMSKEYLPKLFEEFSREQSTTENKIHGTGLGMPIVKRLVELMNGTITVESELGKGTTFVVTIPHRIARMDELQDENQRKDDLPNFMGKRILLAEDNEFNAEIAIEILSDAGFLVERAEDGIQCIDMLQKAEPDYFDLILMDVQMPNMDGYKTTQFIREMDEPKKSTIPIIAMTANAFEEDKRNAIAAGMDGHIAKPIKVARMMELLADRLML